MLSGMIAKSLPFPFEWTKSGDSSFLVVFIVVAVVVVVIVIFVVVVIAVVVDVNVDVNREKNFFDQLHFR